MGMKFARLLLAAALFAPLCLFADPNGLPGGPFPSEATAVAGKDTNGKNRPISVDTSGNVNVTLSSSVVSAPGATPSPSPYKVLNVQGSATGIPMPVVGPATNTELRASALPVAAAEKQWTGVPSNFTIGTTDATVFTLAAGEIGFIQNLSADAPLAVKYGASASTSSFTFILAKGGGASDGSGGAVWITNWVGVVSVAKMTGTASYIASKIAP